MAGSHWHIHTFRISQYFVAANVLFQVFLWSCPCSIAAKCKYMSMGLNFVGFRDDHENRLSHIFGWGAGQISILELEIGVKNINFL